jgi:hypothetical protein
MHLIGSRMHASELRFDVVVCKMLGIGMVACAGVFRCFIVSMRTMT